MFDNARGGNDQLYGGSGNNSLFGEAQGGGFLRAGNDYLDGGSGDDFLVGDGNGLGLGGGSGVGYGGDDYLNGGQGNDILYGDVDRELPDNSVARNDRLYGGAGDDDPLW